MTQRDFGNIINELGIPINWYDFRATYKFNANPRNISDFEHEINSIRNPSFDEFLETMTKYENIFDQDIYVLHLGRLLKSDAQKESNIFTREYKSSVCNRAGSKKTKKDLVEYAKKLLKKSDVVDIRGVENEFSIMSSQEFAGNDRFLEKKEKKAEERISKIEEKIGLENVLNYLKPTDLIDFCRYPNLGNELAIRLTHFEPIKSNEDIFVQDKVKGTSEKIKDSKDMPAKAKIFKWDDFFKTVRENIKYIDIDKMLLLANCVFYDKYGDDLDRFSQEEALQLKEFTDSVESLLANKKVTIISPRFNSAVNFQTIKTSVEALNRHFINGKFCTDEEINFIAEDILYGKRPITSISKSDMTNTMQFTTDELAILCQHNPAALKEMFENGYIEESQIEKIIEKQDTFSGEELHFLYSKNIFDENKIIDLYENSRTDLDSIKYIKENQIEGKDLSSGVSTEKLVRLYSDSKKRNEFDRYKKVYKFLKIDGKSQEEQQEVANDILSQSDDLLENDKIYDLYHLGLIPLDTTIDYIGVEAILEAYSNGELKPADSKRLYDSKIITQDMIKTILQDKSIDDGQKLVLIYSTFPEKEDSEIRDQMMKYLTEAEDSIHEEKNEPKESSETNKKRNKNFPVNRYVSDPCSRWKLMSSLDPEYSQEYLKDGHIVFYLPNKGKYIIEKLYDANRKPAYGAATYIVDEETFKTHEDEIVQDKKINRTKLKLLTNSEKDSAKKVIHTGWGNAIGRYFDIENENQYTKEQMKKIKELADEVEKSKRPLER